MAVKEQTEFKPNPPEMDGAQDMTSLLYLEEPNVVHNLKIRFQKKTVYTFVGSILISMNPYEWISKLYTDEYLLEYKTDSSKDIPHCYKTASKAIYNLKTTGKSQSILVCGESGAGKTESAKCCITYLAKSQMASGDDSFVRQISGINPVLEAFGNAKTTRNNNSSRFGKFTKILFTDFDRENPANSMLAKGCRVESYLLEKSRVVFHEPTERNFHIFYQIFSSSNDRLHLGDMKTFNYIAQTPAHEKNMKISNIDDGKHFKKFMDGLDALNVDKNTATLLTEHVAAILHLGNVKFQDDGKSYAKVSSDTMKHVEYASSLLGVTKEKLSDRLITKKIKVMREQISSTLTLEEAAINRDSISKSLFSALFDWLFITINNFLSKKEDADRSFIAILDIFGFEAFPRNSFEQFCINFTNEKLQQVFSESLIIAEQNEYIAEGVYWIPLEIPSNDKIVTLFSDPKNGIFELLEAACNMPKGTVDIFVSNVFSNHRKNEKIKNVKMTKELSKTLFPKESFKGFLIIHYAEDVIYNCNEFIAKNKDLVQLETSEVLSSSSSPILKSLFPAQKQNRRGVKKNIGKKFLDSLEKLMKNLNSTTQQFVRCINPNSIKSNSHWDENHVIEQIRCAGLIPALKVVKKGYPTRIAYSTLNKNYRSLINHPILEGLSQNEFWQAVLVGFGFPPTQYEFGLTKIFFKPNVPFISNIKQQKGALTEEQIKRIKTFFVTKRFNRLRSVSIAYIRIRKLVHEALLVSAINKSLTLAFAFEKTVSQIREKLKKEKEERERKEKERKERERLALLEKQRIERELREKKSAEERRLAEERMRKEEEQRKEEERIRLEQERIRIEEEKKRAAEELERKRIAALVAVELFFKSEFFNTRSNFEKELQEELAAFFKTTPDRYEIVMSQENEMYIADVRLQEPTEEEKYEKFKSQTLKEAETNLDKNIPKVQDHVNDDPDEADKTLKNKTEKTMVSVEKDGEKTRSSDSQNVKGSELASEQASEMANDQVETKEESVKEEKAVKLIFISKMDLALKLKNEKFEGIDENSILAHIIRKISRNCEPPPVVKKESIPLKKTEKSKSKFLSKPKEVQSELFMFSLSYTADALNPQFKTNPILSDPKCFTKILDDELAEIFTFYEDQQMKIIKTPQIETTFPIICIPKIPIKKSSDGSLDPDSKSVVSTIGKKASQIAEEEKLTIDGKFVIVLNHDDPNWNILRLIKYDMGNIAKNIIYDVCEDWKDWKLQYISEMIICLSRIDSFHLNELREYLFRDSDKTKKMYAILTDKDKPVTQKQTVVKLYWLLHKFIYYEYSIKKGLLTVLFELLSVEDAFLEISGSRKVFTRKNDYKLDIENPNLKNHSARNIFKVLVFAAYYSKKASWDFAIQKGHFTKIIKILAHELEKNELRSDFTINSIMIITSAIQRTRTEIRKELGKILCDNEIGGILKCICIKTSNQFYSDVFASKVAGLIEILEKALPIEKYVELLIPLEPVFDDYVNNIAEMPEIGDLNLVNFATSRKALINNKKKSTVSKKNIFRKLFR